MSFLTSATHFSLSQLFVSLQLFVLLCGVVTFPVMCLFLMYEAENHLKNLPLPLHVSVRNKAQQCKPQTAWFTVDTDKESHVSAHMINTCIQVFYMMYICKIENAKQTFSSWRVVGQEPKVSAQTTFCRGGLTTDMMRSLQLHQSSKESMITFGENQVRRRRE